MVVVGFDAGRRSSNRRSLRRTRETSAGIYNSNTCLSKPSYRPCEVNRHAFSFDQGLLQNGA
ncbi:hypothetical protein HanRHA438_Chr08g0330661 [Helianthus annuus]|nr:hypothetical protein HanRHA438_Chr08g0330661 [Helianthus annuus]KAJ0900126.1 hypothetical protein HanPSC8_Chr08g0309901 [Helianthus annuus]